MKKGTKEKMRNNKGITLVSLVVTIIVLIILAGVSIKLTVGENGIITMAKKARENMELAKVDEERQLNELYEQIIAEGGLAGNASDDAIIRLVEFKREIASAITDMGIETAENADVSTMSSNIRKILGTATADKVSYDNTNSNLVATNVQGAVDEVNNNVKELENDIMHKAIYNGDTPVNIGVYKFYGTTVANQTVDFGIIYPPEGTTIYSIVLTPHANINGIISLYAMPRDDGWHVYAYSNSYSGGLNYSAMITYS